MAVKFSEVSHNYYSLENKSFKALDGINLEINTSGEFLCLVGETGSGKSTLVKHMNALLRPSSGEVSIYGVVVKNKKDRKVKLNPLRQKVGLVFQFPDYQLFEETVLKDVMFGPLNFGLSKEEALEESKKALELVGLDETFYDRVPFNLSGGEKKKVSIAGILSLNPEILIFDEPTSGLDPKSKHDLLDLFIKIHNETNKTVIIITHDMDTIYQYAKRVLVMKSGKLAYDGDVLDLFLKEDYNSLNLHLPELLSIQKNIETKFSIKFKDYPRTTSTFARSIKEVL